MKRITTISLLIAAAFGSNAAQAEVVSNAWLGPVSFTLTDLDLNDGITPSLQFYKAESAVNVEAYETDSAMTLYNYNYHENFVPGVYAAYSDSVSSPLSNANSSLNGTDYANTYAASQGSATGNPGSPPALAGVYNADSAGITYFTLSENTGVTFFADAQSYAASDAPYDPMLNLLEWALAVAYISGQFSYASNGLSHGIGDQAWSESQNNIFNPATGAYENLSQSQSRQLSFTFNNPFAEIVDGKLFQGAGVRGYSYSDYKSPSAVPVPAALPLMLSGLGVLGFASRRRKVV